MAPSLEPLSRRTRLYKKLEKLFNDGWLHPNKTGRIQAIYHVDDDELDASSRGRKFNSYLKSSGGTYQLLFHGTQRSCSLGDLDDLDDWIPCHSGSCHLCSILRGSFRLDRASDGGMFGPGIYTTKASSKADVYAKNHHHRSKRHVILVCRVVNDRPQRLRYAEHDRCAPDHGYNCVEAVTRPYGGSVDYPETVVYREDAIVPVGMIIYTRHGWEPY